MQRIKFPTHACYWIRLPTSIRLTQTVFSAVDWLLVHLLFNASLCTAPHPVVSILWYHTKESPLVSHWKFFLFHGTFPLSPKLMFHYLPPLEIPLLKAPLIPVNNPFSWDSRDNSPLQSSLHSPPSVSPINDSSTSFCKTFLPLLPPSMTSKLPRPLTNSHSFNQQQTTQSSSPCKPTLCVAFSVAFHHELWPIIMSSLTAPFTILLLLQDVVVPQTSVPRPLIISHLFPVWSPLVRARNTTWAQSDHTYISDPVYSP